MDIFVPPGYKDLNPDCVSSNLKISQHELSLRDMHGHVASIVPSWILALSACDDRYMHVTFVDSEVV